MYVTTPATGPMGISIKKGFKKIGKVAKKGVKTTALVVAPVMYVTGKALQLALKPLRSRINTIVTRRARKLSWDRRKTLVYTPSEKSEARKWTKAMFVKKGPHGRIIAALAGSSAHLGSFGATGVEEAAVAAGIAALTKLAANMVNNLNKKGDAPANPTGGVAEAASAAIVERARPQLEQQFAPAVEQVVQEVTPVVEAYDQAIDPTDQSATYDQLEGFGARPGISNLAGGIGIGLGALAIGVGIFAAARR
jgi:tetrahydromethanopterin S-methyltransferase subunit B